MARRVAEEKACDCFRDREAGRAFEPEEFAAGVEFEKDVFAVGCQDDVDGAVVQGEVIHQAQDFFFDFDRELVGPPVLKHADAVASPIVSRACGDLRVDSGRHDALAHDRDANLERL